MTDDTKSADNTGNEQNNDTTEKLGGGAYVVGGLAYIPLLGVIFGIAAIIWGLMTKKRGGKKLAVIGGGGIVFTILIYASLFFSLSYGVKHNSGMFGNLQNQLAQNNITALVQSVEFYKTQTGSYPKDLKTLKMYLPQNTQLYLYDPTKMASPDENSHDLPMFYYENHGDTYYLLGTGKDNTPFTADDILPDVKQGGNVGYRVKGE